MIPALELEVVSKRRGTGRHAVAALSEVTLQVGPAEVVLLEGPSGSGKTTLLAVAAGLLTPDAGAVRVHGNLLALMSPDERRRWRATEIGFVFQRSNLVPALTAMENVLLQAALAGLDAAAAARRASELLEALGIAGLRDRSPAALSAGEEQRVAVARALVHEPTVVLADEPTASLDGAAGRDVVSALTSLARSRRAAVLIATHDPRLAVDGARRFSLVDGRLDGGSAP